MTLLAVASAVALLGLLAWLRRRKAAQAEAQAPLTAMVAEAPGFVGGGQSIDTTKQLAPVSSMMYSPSQLEAVGEVDPLAEADVYLAYGRDQQAEEILRDALRSHPERMSLHLKLLEIYALRHDKAGYEAAATEVYALTRGSGPDWATAREQGYWFDPDNPLYQPPPGQSPAQTPAAAVTPAEAAPPLADTSATLPAALPELDLDFTVPVPPAPAPVTAPAAPAEATHRPAPVELDFDLSQPALLPGSAPAPSSAAASGPDTILEFTPGPAAAEVKAQAPAKSDMSMDFQLDTILPAPQRQQPDSGPESAVASSAEAPAASRMMDFDLDLSEFDRAVAASASQAAPAAPDAGPASDPRGQALDFEPAAPPPAPASSGLSDLEVTEESANADPQETQLALANEFLALGDAEGARMLAEDVVKKATGDLQARARALLARLA